MFVTGAIMSNFLSGKKKKRKSCFSYLREKSGFVSFQYGGLYINLQFEFKAYIP